MHGKATTRSSGWTAVEGEYSLQTNPHTPLTPKRLSPQIKGHQLSVNIILRNVSTNDTRNTNKSIKPNRFVCEKKKRKPINTQTTVVTGNCVMRVCLMCIRECLCQETWSVYLHAFWKRYQLHVAFIACWHLHSCLYLCSLLHTLNQRY